MAIQKFRPRGEVDMDDIHSWAARVAVGKSARLWIYHWLRWQDNRDSSTAQANEVMKSMCLEFCMDTQSKYLIYDSRCRVWRTTERMKSTFAKFPWWGSWKLDEVNPLTKDVQLHISADFCRIILRRRCDQTFVRLIIIVLGSSNSQGRSLGICTEGSWRGGEVGYSARHVSAVRFSPFDRLQLCCQACYSALYCDCVCSS